MTLYFVGLGLDNEKDISLKGLEIIRKCDLVYLENYTSKLNCNVKDLEKLYGKKIVLADRKLVEEGKEILEEAKKKNVALLVIGDVFSATTHISLFSDAKKKRIKTFVVNNASVISAIGVTGLSLYKFGKVISIPFSGKVKSSYSSLKSNLKNDLHTLVLLDLNPEENKFMTIKEAVKILLKEGFNENTLCVGCAKLGSLKPEIKVGKAKNLNLKNKPQCLIIPGKLHFMEEEALGLWK